MKMISGFIKYIFSDYWEENSDPRSRHIWLVNGGPTKILAILLFYLFFCLHLGPSMMKNRKPFHLRKLMIFYNITTALLNAYFFCATIYYLNYCQDLFDFKFPNRRTPTIVTDLDRAKVQNVNWFVLSKFYDLMDTIFFVLRKKDNQITGLHLYHHTLTPFICWAALKLAATAPCLGLFPLLNSLVHTIMYSYYALAALGPRVQRYLWWKKYITQLQLIQFVIYGLYMIPFLALQDGYPVDFWMFVVGLPQPFVFFYLFYRFYRRSYHSTTSSNNTNNDDLIDLNHQPKSSSSPDPAHCYDPEQKQNGGGSQNNIETIEHLKAN